MRIDGFLSIQPLRLSVPFIFFKRTMFDGRVVYLQELKFWKRKSFNGIARLKLMNTKFVEIL